MTELPVKRMTVDEYLAWAEAQPRGRFELISGIVVEMPSQRVLHVRTKVLVATAFSRAVAEAGIEAEALGDGATVPIDQYTAYEPDALIYAGPRIGGDEFTVPNPVVVAEVLSPSSERTDTGTKLIGYTQVESIRHYLIIDPYLRAVVHHSRPAGDAPFTSRIETAGTFRLEALGLELLVGDLLPPPE